MNIDSAAQTLNAHRIRKGLFEFTSLSVFIGVYRWIKKVFNHRCTPMNTDKSLMKKIGKGLLSQVPCSGQVTL
jgi:hypothetical protein